MAERALTIGEIAARTDPVPSIARKRARGLDIPLRGKV
jgi:hypothetical protein